MTKAFPIEQAYWSRRGSKKMLSCQEFGEHRSSVLVRNFGHLSGRAAASLASPRATPLAAGAAARPWRPPPARRRQRRTRQKTPRLPRSCQSACWAAASRSSRRPRPICGHQCTCLNIAFRKRDDSMRVEELCICQALLLDWCCWCWCGCTHKHPTKLKQPFWAAASRSNPTRISLPSSTQDQVGWQQEMPV